MVLAGYLYAGGAVLIAVGLGLAFKSSAVCVLTLGVGALAGSVFAFVLAKDAGG